MYRTGANHKPTAGYHGGIFIDLPVIGNLSLQPEVLISYQGSGNGDNYGNGTFFSKVERTKLFYCNIPVLVKYNLPIKGMTLLIGPQFRKLISANEKGVWLDRFGNEQDSEQEAGTVMLILIF